MLLCLMTLWPFWLLLLPCPNTSCLSSALRWAPGSVAGWQAAVLPPVTVRGRSLGTTGQRRGAAGVGLLTHTTLRGQGPGAPRV